MANAEIVRQAATWAALLDAGADAQQRAACEDWCRQDSRHRVVLERMRGFDAALGQLDEAQRRLLRQAAQDAAPPRNRRRAALALVLLATTLTATYHALRPPGGIVAAHTLRGEQRNIALSDQSTLLLDADSDMQMRFDTTTRTLALHRGRVLAMVATDARRPFIVETADASATAFGTAYVVRTGSDGTRVTVVESNVRVCARVDLQCRDLRAGQSVQVAGGRMGLPESADPQVALAWTRGWLEADDRPAIEVLQELAAYLEVPLRFDVGELREVRVTGSYPLQRPRAALGALADTAGLIIESAPDGSLVLRRHR